MTIPLTIAWPAQMVDAHHHLWHLDKITYPWLNAKGVPRFFGDPTPIQRHYLVHHLLEDIGDLPVQQSVHIQVGAAENDHLKETGWLQQQVDEHGWPSAIVAFCDLTDQQFVEQLALHMAHSAVRGIRQIVGRSPLEDKTTGTNRLLANPAWLNGLKTLQQHGLSFDLQLIPEQMQAICELLKQVPELKVALCHCGSPWPLNERYRSDEYWQVWRGGLRALATLPNVHCKISGLAMFQQRWCDTTLTPVIETVIETFGVERCLFGSNFPVDKLHTRYANIWQCYNRITQGYSASERAALFGKNAQAFYRI